MSGGHFDYGIEYKLSEAVDEISRLIKTNNVADEYGYVRNYSDKVLLSFREACEVLNLASIYIHNIDYLISGDYGEDTFNEAMKNDLDIFVKTLATKD